MGPNPSSGARALSCRQNKDTAVTVELALLVEASSPVRGHQTDLCGKEPSQLLKSRKSSVLPSAKREGAAGVIGSGGQHKKKCKTGSDCKWQL